MFTERSKKVEFSRAEMFVLDVLGAVLEEQLGKRIYFTQVGMKRTSPAKLDRDGKDSRRFEIEALFTGVNDPTRYGREGIPPVFPSVSATIVIESKESWVFSWKVASMTILTEHVDGPAQNFGYPGSPRNSDPPRGEQVDIPVSEAIQNFAAALWRRGLGVIRSWEFNPQE